MTEMVHGTLTVAVGEPIFSRWWRTVDRWSLFCIVLLFAIGLLLALASSPPLAARTGLPPFYFFNRQLIFGLIALGLMVSVSLLSPLQVRRFGTLGFVIVLSILAALPLIGADYGKGAVRWLSLGFISVQPSEFLKPMLAVTLGWLFSAALEPNGPPGKMLSLFVLGVALALLVIQPDYGQAALVLFTWGVMYFVAGAALAPVVVSFGVACFVGVIAYGRSAHFARRIDSFLADEVDARSQIGYATSAIQEGGLFGVGLGEGQVKWQLPDAHTDFVIAVAAEEYGFALVAVIIALYAILCLRALMRLARERDPFCRIAGAGLAAVFSAQAMINLGVAARLLPAKGMTLPLVSYGGSSLLAAGITVGMLLSLTRSRPQGELVSVLSGRTARADARPRAQKLASGG